MGEHPPAGAEHAVNVYIWRLRKALQAGSGTHGVVTRQGAYLLQAAAEQVDVALFERLAEEGRRALAVEAAGHASAELGEALALWRGGRWPISGSSRSRRQRSPGWRNCGRGWWRTGSRLSSRSASRAVVGELEALVAAIRCESARISC